MKLTIYDINRAVSDDSHYFDRATLRFFNQRLSDFSVWNIKGRYFFAAISKWGDRIMGVSAMEFKPEYNNNGEYINKGELIHIPEYYAGDFHSKNQVKNWIKENV
jgi:hypothetical protein